jgi:ribulose-phosphate 3-epimerase
MCGDLGALGQEAKKLEDAGVDSLHIDVMDGHFVPNLTFGPGTVSAIRRATQLPLHVHMMVGNPGDHVRSFAESGADLFYFHIETALHPLRLSSAITESGMTAGVAINPFTPLAAVVDLPLPHVLVMSVEPGFAGQRWVPHTARRLHQLRHSLDDDVTIGVDGNVTEDNAVLAYENGASLFVCGTSSIFAGDDYASAAGQMRNRLRAVQRLAPEEG